MGLANRSQVLGVSYSSRRTVISSSEESGIKWGFLPFGDGKITSTQWEADGLNVLIEWVRNGITTLDIAYEIGLLKMASGAIALGKLVKKGRGYSFPEDQAASMKYDEKE